MLTFSSSMDIPYIFFDCWICQTMLTLLREVYHNYFWHFLIILNRLICLIKYTVVGGWILLCFMTPALMLAQCSLCSGYRHSTVWSVLRGFSFWVTCNKAATEHLRSFYFLLKMPFSQHRHAIWRSATQWLQRLSLRKRDFMIWHENASCLLPAILPAVCDIDCNSLLWAFSLIHVQTASTRRSTLTVGINTSKTNARVSSLQSAVSAIASADTTEPTVHLTAALASACLAFFRRALQMSRSSRRFSISRLSF